MTGSEAHRTNWELSPEPGWLDTGGEQVFCWYHPAARRQLDMAVLLCDPLGSDRMNLHLAYRHLALALSQAGLPTLRLDYPGTCDSSGSPRDPERLSAIFASLHAGADYLKRVSGCQRLALFGARFGGTVAAEFASQREDISHLGLWGPYAKGRSFLRSEVVRERLSNSNPDNRKPTSWQPNDVEALGFLYTAQTVGDIESLSIARIEIPTSVKSMVFDWDTTERSDDVVDLLVGRGNVVTHISAIDPGAESLHHQRVPSALIGTFSSWLCDDAVYLNPPPSTDPFQRLSKEVEVQIDKENVVRERCYRFGRRDELFGVVSMPKQAPAFRKPRAIVIVNGGNNHRVGINRNHVEWARHWASRGDIVLRFDIRGLGDSPPRKPAELNKLYLKRTVDDLSEAADWTQETFSVDHLVFCGLCAGAYQALQFSRADFRVRSLILLEMLRFYPWEPLHTSRNVVVAKLTRLWTKLHPMWLLDRNRVGKWLLKLAKNDTKCLIVYREDEKMLDRFRTETSATQRASQDTQNYRLHEVGSSNHIISPLWAQEELKEVLNEHLGNLDLPP